MKFSILYILLFLLTVDCQAVSGPVNFRRVCTSGSDLVLQWVVPEDNCGSFRVYYIYGRQKPSDPFVLIDSVTTYSTNQYIHPGAYAVSTTWQYFIVARFLCDGITPAPSSDTLTINLQPSQPVIDSVSVDIINNRVLIGWKNIPDPDLKNYKVNLLPGPTFKGFVTGNTFFISIPEDPKTSSFSYRISATDSCQLEGPLSLIHHTVKLEFGANIDTFCNPSVDLLWNHYAGFDPVENKSIGWPVARYEIYMARNLGPFIKVGQVDGLVNNFHCAPIPLGDSLTFFVRAFSSSTAATSSSNSLGLRKTTLRTKPTFCYLRCADVIDDSKTKLTWFPDLAGDINYYKVFRSSDGLNYAEIPNSKINNDLISEKSFTDEQSPASSGRAYYRIVSYDICDSPLIVSNVAITSYIQAKSLGNESVHVSWTSYVGFENGVKDYQLFRGVNLGGGITWTKLDLFKDSSYKDIKLPDDVGEDGICYRVLAHENGTNKYGFSDSCNSNTYCAQQPIIAFFPTAFVPTGVNTTFKPVCSFVNLPASFMVIYNRWGGVVKTITDLNKGWDGTSDNGKPMPEGVYVYYATLYGNLNSVTKIYSGSFYLFNSE